MAQKGISKWQFGDFQTPITLAREVVSVVTSKHNINPNLVVEPTCGDGSFLCAIAECFPDARIRGFDVNPDHIDNARAAVKEAKAENVSVEQSDFFLVNWQDVLSETPGELLVLGNPPWVTSSELGVLNSENLPEKTNFQGKRGIEAITGSANFDISEWMLLQHVEWLSNRTGTIAFLCKYAVARKIMRKVRTLGKTELFGHIYLIDAKEHFSASVDACLFVLSTEGGNTDCEVFESLTASEPAYVIGEREGVVVRDIYKYERTKDLKGQDPAYVWRSGVKHDCSKVMELTPSKNGFINGFGDQIQIEDRFVFPLLKSSDVANNRITEYRKGVIVPQTSVGADTSIVHREAPKTWSYLERHDELLKARKSSIYRGKPPYSIFGVGDYTFSPWKVAISSMYKSLNFCIVGPINGKPVVFDDTVVFLSCQTRQEAEFLLDLLRSAPAQEFLGANVFWDEKRPITTNVLRRLSLKAVAIRVDQEKEYQRWCRRRL